MDIKEIVDYYNGLPSYVTPPKTDLVNSIMDAFRKEFGLEVKEKYMGRERNFMKSADKPFLCW